MKKEIKEKIEDWGKEDWQNEIQAIRQRLNKLTPTRFEQQEWRGIDNYGETTT